MKSANSKWTQEMRKFVYANVVTKYGVASNWETENYPKSGQKEEFESFLELLSEQLNAFYLPKGKRPITAGAIAQQIRFALGKRVMLTSLKKENIHMLPFVMENTVAAISVGLIKPTDIGNFSDEDFQITAQF